MVAASMARTVGEVALATAFMTAGVAMVHESVDRGPARSEPEMFHKVMIGGSGAGAVIGGGIAVHQAAAGIGRGAAAIPALVGASIAAGIGGMALGSWLRP
jgi:hypothetical protein